MICPKCNSNIPDGTPFCPVCGEDLSVNKVNDIAEKAEEAAKETVDEVIEETEAQKEESVAAVPDVQGEFKMESVPAEAQDKTNSGNGGKGSPWLFIGIAAALAVLAIVLAFLNIRKANTAKALTAEAWSVYDTAETMRANIDSEKEMIAGLDIQIADLESRIGEEDEKAASLSAYATDADTTIESLKLDLDNLTSKVDSGATDDRTLKNLIDTVNEYKIGNGASHFHMANSVIVVKAGASVKVDLTAHWGRKTTNIKWSYNRLIATIQHTGSNSWDKTTEMTITGVSKGISHIDFKNDSDDVTFSILVIVTD